MIVDLLFWDHIDVAGSCWEWSKHVNKKGYGVVGRSVNGKSQKMAAHRYAYEQLVGPIPAGLVLDHLCRNTRCVNPDHLEPVTNEENLRRSPLFHGGCCRAGHRFTTINIYWESNPNGRRYRRCRVCAASSKRRRWAAHG